jgi:hypothetical protein
MIQDRQGWMTTPETAIDFVRHIDEDTESGSAEIMDVDRGCPSSQTAKNRKHIYGKFYD